MCSPLQLETAWLARYNRRKRSEPYFRTTNQPMITPESCLSEMAGLGLDEATSELFLYKNAETVFGLSSRAP
jgi:hypothetical protein